jgi:hypothetical protein
MESGAGIGAEFREIDFPNFRFFTGVGFLGGAHGGGSRDSFYFLPAIK